MTPLPATLRSLFLVGAGLGLVAAPASAAPFVAPFSAPPVAQAGSGAAGGAGAAAPRTPASAPPAKGAVKKGRSSGPKQFGPVIIDPAEVDFGVVAPETTVEAEVTITNTTSHPIKVLAAVPSCTCTTVSIAGQVIPAGGSLPMPMSMKTSASTGEKVAAVKMMFEGHPDPVQVVIRSEVAYSVRATPPYIDIQQAPKTPQGTPDTPRPLAGSFTLSSTDGKPFSVISVLGAEPVFAGPSAGFKPGADAPRNSYTLAYDFTSTPANQVPAYVIVETDRADCPALDLRVRHENTHIKPTFKIAEFRSAVGRIEPGKSGRFELEIKEVGGRTVKSVTSKNPAVATARLLEQKPDGKSVLMTAEVTPAASFRGPLYFPVTITLDDGRSTDLWVFGSVR